LDRKRQALRYGRKTSARCAVEKAAPATTLGSCGLVFQATLEAAHFTIAQQPLAFTIPRSLHGHATGVAAIACWGARRIPHGFVTSRAITKNFGMFFAA
jgi:hypothetical protein